MRMLRVAIAAAMALVLGVTVPAAARATAPENTTVQFGAVGQAPPPVENSITPSALHIRPGGTVTFNVDGFHQPLAYRLRFHESFEQAFARLDARVDETDDNGLLRRRMAGQDTFVALPAETPPAADQLTLRDLFSGYLFLGPDKVPPPIVTQVVSPPALPGRYILLCNVPSHYKFDFEGRRYSMSATLVVG
jgi:hypothetical protein